MTAVRSVGGIVRAKAAKKKSTDAVAQTPGDTQAPAPAGAVEQLRQRRVAGSIPVGVHQSFTVRLDIPSRALSPNGSHGHWAKKARAAKNYRDACAWLFADAKPIGWKVSPVEIEIIYRQNRCSPGYQARDTGNAIAALKSGIDGMVDAGVIPDDSAKWLTWGRFELKTRLEVGVKDGVYITVKGRV